MRGNGCLGTRAVSGWAVTFVLAFALPACFVYPDVSLPTTVTVALPDGTSLEVPSSSGAESFADSTWSVYEDSTQGSEQTALDSLSLLLRIEFGSAGEVVRIFDNQVFAPETIGGQLIVDGQVHPAPFPGSSYVCTGYGGEGAFGVSFAGLGRFFAGPMTLAEATISIMGTLGPAEDHLEGTLVLEIQLTEEGDILLGDAPIDTNTQMLTVIAIKDE